MGLMGHVMCGHEARETTCNASHRSCCCSSMLRAHMRLGNSQHQANGKPETSRWHSNARSGEDLRHLILCLAKPTETIRDFFSFHNFSQALQAGSILSCREQQARAHRSVGNQEQRDS